MSKLIRDNKNILNFLVKKAYPYRDVITTTFFDEIRLPIPIKDRLINNTNLPLMRYDTKSQKVHTPNNGYIYYVDLMSRAGSGKDGRVILSIDDVLRGRFGLAYFNLPSIATDNDYDIPLGGAF